MKLRLRWVDRPSRIGRYMGRNLTKKEKELPEAKPYIRWKWNHLLQAFYEMGMIEKGTTQTDFANFLVQVLPDRKVANILQSLYRNCDKKSDNIMADVKDEFAPVLALLKKAQK